MASAADMNHALRNKLIELQGWTLVLLLCFSCLHGRVNSQELSDDEMDALQALKRAWITRTPDFDVHFEGWNSSLPCGDLNTPLRDGAWDGVVCYINSTWPTGVTVTRLNQGEKGIVGVLPSNVSKLSNLEELDLSNNLGLSGPISKELVQLRNLSVLELSNNMFSGEFPFRFITNGSKLRWFEITKNRFNGTIGEDAFQNLGYLEYCDLSYNMMSGEFPFRSIINGSKISQLDISNNRFNGTIGEDGFQNLGQLRALSLSSNRLVGQVPSVSHMKELKMLNLDSNKFTGQAPNLSNLIALSYLNMSHNKFEGQIQTIPKVANLNNLDLSRNNFSGQAPDISKMTNLSTLDLSQNVFEGQAPDVSRLQYLTWLDLSHNYFTGHLPKLPIIPKSNYSGLTHINLSSNHFTELADDLLPFLNKLPETLTLLDLSSVHVGGDLAPHFSNLSLPVSLSALYLDKNNFVGTLNITAFLQSNASQSLKILSLKDNMITDVLSPHSTTLKILFWLTRITLVGNPYCKRTWTSQDETNTCNFYCANTCIDPKKREKDGRILIMASSIGSAVVVLVAFMLIVGFGIVLRGKERYIQDLQKKIKEADVNAKKYDFNELRIATKNFAPEVKLGEGGYGAVYKGILASGIVVAVKQLFLNTCASREDFVNEVLLISNLQHQNLVALKGYCLKDRQTLLVYEYVDNCDLDKLLLSQQATTERTSQGLQFWKTRLKICQGVAQGLNYLHTFSQSRIIHRDIKASNILVNENFEAKIADFGLARLIAGSVIETNRCAGTFGYLAPEYATEGQLSEKADVYSFGVLLLEIVSGMRNQDKRLPEDEMHLAIWARKLHQTKRLLDMIDPMLVLNKDEVEELQQVLETAMLCVQNNPKKRPAMIQVAAMLGGKENSDELLPIDEELNNLPLELALEESNCDFGPLFDSSTSTSASLMSRSACNPQIELSSSKNGRQWRTR